MHIELCILCVQIEEGDTCAHEANKMRLPTQTLSVAAKPHNIKLMAKHNRKTKEKKNPYKYERKTQETNRKKKKIGKKHPWCTWKNLPKLRAILFLLNMSKKKASLGAATETWETSA